MGSSHTCRIAARLDIKGPNLIKGIQLEGLRVIGAPNEYALKYYQDGVDELIFIDSVASLYGRNQLHEIISDAVKDIFVPITVGGGIRSVDDVKLALRSGADKVAINTAAVKRPKLISDIASRYGSQCVVLSIEAKRFENRWEVYTDNGREKTGLDVIEWAKRAVNLGAGEVLLTSVDRDGTRIGLDIDLLRILRCEINCPLIVSGGVGSISHVKDAINLGADAVAIASAFHYNKFSIDGLKLELRKSNIDVRKT